MKIVKGIDKGQPIYSASYITPYGSKLTFTCRSEADAKSWLASQGTQPTPNLSSAEER